MRAVVICSVAAAILLSAAASTAQASDKVKVGTLGSSNSSAVNEALKLGSLTWNDATMVEINFPQHLAAYANKAIDASMTNEPTVTRAVQEGLAARVAGNDVIYPGQQTAVVLY